MTENQHQFGKDMQMGRANRLEGRTAFVTGAAKPDSIGFATASELGKEGARLVVVDVSEQVSARARDLQELGYVAYSYTADLTDSGRVEEIVADVITSLGAIDVLVNNAGLAIAGPTRPPYEHLVDMDEAKWDFGIAINLKTQFNCCRAILPHMVRQGYGRVINISSTTGPIGASTGQPEYCAAKAGVLGLTRGIALEVASEGVLVNAVAPGWTDTGGSSPRGLAAGKATPVKRACRPIEIAKLIAFLASDYNTYLTGQLIVIDGGNSLDEYHGPDMYDV
jgi:3-oxoacyl-[acyl-carrier protein] reductase